MNNDENINEVMNYLYFQDFDKLIPFTLLMQNGIEMSEVCTEFSDIYLLFRIFRVS